jgi:hypothetical protein
MKYQCYSSRDYLLNPLKHAKARTKNPFAQKVSLSLPYSYISISIARKNEILLSWPTFSANTSHHNIKNN